MLTGSWSASTSPARSPSPGYHASHRHPLPPGYGTTSLEQRYLSPNLNVLQKILKFFSPSLREQVIFIESQTSTKIDCILSRERGVPAWTFAGPGAKYILLGRENENRYNIYILFIYSLGAYYTFIGGLLISLHIRFGMPK